MKKLLLILAALLLLLSGCAQRASTEAQTTIGLIYHEGQLWEIPLETTGIGLDEAELTEATMIDPHKTPEHEGECNANVERAQIYDGDDYFLVVIDGNQYFIKR